MHAVFVFEPLARSLARIALLAVLLTFAAYTAAFVVLLARYRLPAWTSPSGFLEGRGQPWFRLLTFCQVCALATPLFFTAFVAAVAASVSPPYSAPALIALCASGAFATLSAVYYVVQVRLAAWSPTENDAESLGHLFQLNPAGVFTSVNILAWTLFFALACVFLAPLFLASGGLAMTTLGALLLANTAVCALGLAGYLGRVRALNVLFFNGMGVLVLAFSLLGALTL